MKIGGLLKFSLIDYPGKRAAVVFTQGCNFRCPYCHNPELVRPELFRVPLPEEELFGFLDRRRGALEGVVITGGEPTLQLDLAFFIERIKGLGFLVKLDTNGTRPDVLRDLLDRDLVDYVAMDLKTSPGRYDEAAGVKVRIDDIRRSIALLKEGRTRYEFRATACRPVCGADDIKEIQRLAGGASRCRLQPFVPGDHLLDPAICAFPQYSPTELAALRAGQ
jgi:pyruvate formate lyase activating enzyme